MRSLPPVDAPTDECEHSNHNGNSDHRASEELLQHLAVRRVKVSGRVNGGHKSTKHAGEQGDPEGGDEDTTRRQGRGDERQPPSAKTRAQTFDPLTEAREDERLHLLRLVHERLDSLTRVAEVEVNVSESMVELGVRGKCPFDARRQ